MPDTHSAKTMRDPRIPPTVGFGDRLRRFRLSQGLGQRQLAAKVGMRPATLAAYETSEFTPKSAALVAQSIELIFGLPADWLLGRGEWECPQRASDMPKVRA
jgi:transcriptional regulator with XRE-family HTH domain